MLNKLWQALVRFRTWVVNAVSVAILFLPDVLSVLANAQWDGIIPDTWVRGFAIALALVNIWMRPRPAATKQGALERRGKV
jgi:hypothetical protein